MVFSFNIDFFFFLSLFWAATLYQHHGQSHIFSKLHLHTIIHYSTHAELKIYPAQTELWANKTHLTSN